MRDCSNLPGTALHPLERQSRTGELQIRIGFSFCRAYLELPNCGCGRANESSACGSFAFQGNKATHEKAEEVRQQLGSIAHPSRRETLCSLVFVVSHSHRGFSSVVRTIFSNGEPFQRFSLAHYGRKPLKRLAKS